jgi:hypothetical protein
MRSPTYAPREMVCVALQLPPAAGTFKFKLEGDVEHAMLVAENTGFSSLLLGTLHATSASDVGVEPDLKVQVRPLAHGRGPLTKDVLPFSWYLQVGATQSAVQDRDRIKIVLDSLQCKKCKVYMPWNMLAKCI